MFQYVRTTNWRPSKSKSRTRNHKPPAIAALEKVEPLQVAGSVWVVEAGFVDSVAVVTFLATSSVSSVAQPHVQAVRPPGTIAWGLPVTG